MDPSYYGELAPPRNPGVWTVLNRFLITAIIFAVCAVGALALMPLLKEQNSVSARIEELRGKIVREKALLSRNIREEEMLKNNPEYVEMIARDRLNLMKPGEIIIHLESTAPSASPSPGAEEVKR